MTDAELLQLAQGGDKDAWQQLYARCVPSVWRQARALTGNTTLAEDVVSETMLALVRSLPRLDCTTVQLQAWLRGVVRHKVADAGRQLGKHRRLAAAASERADQGQDAESRHPLEVEEDRRQIAQVLDQLPDQQREYLHWKYVDGLSVREICKRTGQSEKSVESVLYRARREFRQRFERQDSESTGDAVHMKAQSGSAAERGRR